MRIGSAWKCTSEDGTKEWIGLKLDETIIEMAPQLKNISLKLWTISESERNQDNSPHFSITANLKQNKE